MQLEFTHRAAADRGDTKRRGKCEAEHTERREIFLDCCSIIRQKMGKLILFLLIFVLCLSVTLQKNGKRCLSTFKNKPSVFDDYTYCILFFHVTL